MLLLISGITVAFLIYTTPYIDNSSKHDSVNVVSSSHSSRSPLVSSNVPLNDIKNDITAKSAQKAVFFENITSNTNNITYKLIPQISGNYKVIYIFKENRNIISYGDKLFYNVSRQNPIRFNIPHHNLTVESYIEIYSLDGDLLHSFKWNITPSNHTN